MTDKVRILVVDDHPFFRRGLVDWLNQQEEMVCCGEASSAAATRAACERLQPAVVLLDLQLEDGDGLDLVSELSDRYPSMRILILSHRDESIYAHRALRAGARGYVMKSEATETVLAAVRTVLSGDIHVSRSVGARVLQRLFPDPSSSGPELARLTDRELQVFQLLGSGCGTREIATILKISPKTVETYRENLKHKLGLGDAAALLKAAAHWVADGKLE